jgi:hypothetical protein
MILAEDLRDVRDLETRKELREKAWQAGGWADTVSKV